MKFIRIKGRVIPIKLKQVGAAIGAGVLAGVAATKIRQTGMEALRGKGKKGTGSALGTFALDTVLAGSALALLSRKFKNVQAGIGIIKRAGSVKL